MTGSSLFGAACLILFLIATPVAQAQSTTTWAFRYGTANTDDIFRGIETACDGGYVIAGHTTVSGHGNDILLIKLDEDGAIVWQKTFGGTGDDRPRSIKAVCDPNSYAITGVSQGVLFVMKITVSGNVPSVAWQKKLPGGDFAHAIEKTTNGYLIGGYRVVSSQQDYYVARLDNAGALVWQKTYRGTGSSNAGTDDVIRVVEQLSDGDYVVAGWSESVVSTATDTGDIWVLKLDDANGNVIWQKRYGDEKFEEPGSIVEVSDGIIIMEESASFLTSGQEGFIFKVSKTDGSLTWQKGLNAGGKDELSAGLLTPDGDLVVAGEHQGGAGGDSNFWLVRFEISSTPNNPSVSWQRWFGGALLDQSEDMALAPNGYVMAGTTASFGAGGGQDIWVVKVKSDGTLNSPGNCDPDVTETGQSTSAAFNTRSSSLPNPSFTTATPSNQPTNTNYGFSNISVTQVEKCPVA